MGIAQFPGTNYHDLNLDWLVEEMKKCLAEWAAVHTEWENLVADNATFKATINAEWDELRAFVTNYFNTLDVSAEISAKIDAMAADGSLLALLADTAESVTTETVTNWLSENITQETGYVIDASLSTYNAAADAFHTGAGIRAINNESHWSIEPRNNDLEHNIFVLSSVNYNTGGVVSSDHTRACSIIMSPLKYGHISATLPYEFTVLVYDSSYAYVGVIGPDGTWTQSTNVKWFNEFDLSQYDKNHYFRIQIRNRNATAVDLTYPELQANITMTYSNTYFRYMNQMIAENALFENVVDVQQWRNQTLVSGTAATSTTHWLTINECEPWLYPYVYIDKTNLPENVTDIYMYIYIYAGNMWYPYRSNGQLTTQASGGPAVKFSAFFPVQYVGNMNYRIELVAVDSSGNEILVENLPARVHFLKSKYYITDKKESINILFIGNSLTQDAVSYVPYVLKQLYGSMINYRIGIYYNGGYTLAQTYTQFTNGGNAEIVSFVMNNTTWENFNNSRSIDWILSRYTWNVICMQEYFNYGEQTPEAYNNCVDYIINHYTGGNPLKFIELLHAPKRDNATEIYNRTVAGCQQILAQTPCEDCVNPGTAVYRALSTSLNNMGDRGGLSPDGTHTQEGLPCLLQAFVVVRWLMDWFGIENKSFYNNSIRITTAIYNTISAPGPNLGTGVIPGTDAENLLAQRLAINANNEKKKIVTDAF